MRGNGRGSASPATAQPAAVTLLEHLEHLLDGRERELEVDLRELELAVGALVLVAEAARDLEVAVEARDHQQLLHDLRRLRQRVERPGLQPARHEEVARALGRALGEDRRLDLEEAQPHSDARTA
jgi:hypothetical protein